MSSEGVTTSVSGVTVNIGTSIFSRIKNMLDDLVFFGTNTNSFKNQVLNSDHAQYLLPFMGIWCGYVSLEKTQWIYDDFVCKQVFGYFYVFFSKVWRFIARSITINSIIRQLLN